MKTKAATVDSTPETEFALCPMNAYPFATETPVEDFPPPASVPPTGLFDSHELKHEVEAGEARIAAAMERERQLAVAAREAKEAAQMVKGRIHGQRSRIESFERAKAGFEADQDYRVANGQERREFAYEWGELGEPPLPSELDRQEAEDLPPLQEAAKAAHTSWETCRCERIGCDLATFRLAQDINRSVNGRDWELKVYSRREAHRTVAALEDLWKKRPMLDAATKLRSNVQRRERYVADLEQEARALDAWLAGNVLSPDLLRVRSRMDSMPIRLAQAKLLALMDKHVLARAEREPVAFRSMLEAEISNLLDMLSNTARSHELRSAMHLQRQQPAAE